MGPSQFIAALKQGKTGAAYFLRGPDRFLQEECRKALVASIPPEARQWCLAEVEFEPGRLRHELEAADQMPMLGARQFFFFSDPEDFKHAGDDDVEALRAYLDKPSPFATLVFAAAEPDRRRRFIQLLEKKAELVEMRPLGRADAAAWVKEHLADAGVAIAPDLAEEVAAKFEASPDTRGESKAAGVNLLWLRTELDKLLTAKPGQQRLEAEDLELIVAFREEHEIGKLLRAIAQRQCGEALDFLRSLLRSKVAETLLLWSVGDLFRQALRAAAAPGYGRVSMPYRGGRGGSRPGNPYSTFEVAQVAVKNYSREELLQGLRAVRRADIGIKSSWKDSRILLEVLVWQVIAGKATAGESVLGEEIPVPSAEG